MRARGVTIPIRYWDIAIGIGDIDRYWYWLFLFLFLFLIPPLLVFVTADFLTKKALLGRDIDFRQSLIRDLLPDGGLQETNRGFDCSFTTIFRQTLPEIIISAQKCFLTEKIKCLILTI